MLSSLKTWHKVVLIPLSAAFIYTYSGCDKTKPVGTVSGRVTYKGNAVTMGSVNLISTFGSADLAWIDEQGMYKTFPLEVGEYKVYLLAPFPGQLPPGQKAPPPTAKFEVPKQYLSPETSGMTITVKPGVNDYPIDVK